MGSTAPVAVLLALTCTLCVNVLLHLRLHISMSIICFPGISPDINLFSEKTKKKKQKQSKHSHVEI